MDTSTIIDVTANKQILLREGGYAARVLRESCPGLVIPGADAPGA